MNYEINETNGATINYYTDRQACTVIAQTERTITVREDKAELDKTSVTFHIGGFAAHVTGTQKWAYTPDPEGRVHKFSKRKDGRWVLVGQTSSPTLTVGVRAHHYDFNF